VRTVLVLEPYHVRRSQVGHRSGAVLRFGDLVLAVPVGRARWSSGSWRHVGLVNSVVLVRSSETGGGCGVDPSRIAETYHNRDST
jgi:hypothetical protein